VSLEITTIGLTEVANLFPIRDFTGIDILGKEWIAWVSQDRNAVRRESAQLICIKDDVVFIIENMKY